MSTIETTKTTTPEQDTLLHALAQFSGTENHYRHGLIRGVTYTDGVQYLAITAGAYWLVDDIAWGETRRDVRAEDFQVWHLARKGRGATLTCDDGNGRVVYSKRISYTDFPLSEIKLYCCYGTIMLPTEY